MTLPDIYQLYIASAGITTDSRHCPPGSLFIALTGDNFNGNTFAAQALAAGAAHAIIDDPAYAPPGDSRYITVPNTLHTLQHLATLHRNRLGTRVLAITGTNGKTTTKELVAAVLSQSYHILYTQGNLNNHIGVPLTLLQLKPEHDIAIIEMGANHPGEIQTLAQIADPDYGLITNVGKAHLEGFGSFEGVIRTKGELYDHLRQKSNPRIFICHDNSYLNALAGNLPQTPYGTADDIDINGHITGNSLYLSFTWKEGKDGLPHQVTTQLVGNYNFFNALAAVTVGHFFHLTPQQINTALTNYTPQNNRSQLLQTPTNTLIIDAYNANPSSMTAAIENFQNMNAPHKYLILGDMQELGADTPAEHQKITDLIAAYSFEKVIFVGPHFTAVAKPGHTAYPTVDDLITALQTDKPHDKTILIKGSNSMKLNRLIQHL